MNFFKVSCGESKRILCGRDVHHYFISWLWGSGRRTGSVSWEHRLLPAEEGPASATFSLHTCTLDLAHQHCWI